MRSRRLLILTLIFFSVSPRARAEYGADLDQNFNDITPRADPAHPGYSQAVLRAIQGYRLGSDYGVAKTPDPTNFVNGNGSSGTTSTQNFWNNAASGTQADFDHAVTGMSRQDISDMSKNAPAGQTGMPQKLDSAHSLAAEGQTESFERAIRLFNKAAELATPGAGGGTGTFTGDPNAAAVLDEAYGAYQAAQVFGKSAQENATNAAISKLDDGTGAQTPTPSQVLPHTNEVFSPAAQALLTSLGMNPDTVMNRLQNGDGSVFTNIADKLGELNEPGDVATGDAIADGSDLPGGTEPAEVKDIGGAGALRGAARPAGAKNSKMAARTANDKLAVPRYGPGRTLASGGIFNRAFIKARARRRAKGVIDDDEEGADGVKRLKAKQNAAASGSAVAGLVDRVRKSWNAGDLYDLQRLGIQSRRFHNSIFEIARLTYHKKAEARTVRGAKRSAWQKQATTWRVAGE